MLQISHSSMSWGCSVEPDDQGDRWSTLCVHGPMGVNHYHTGSSHYKTGKLWLLSDACGQKQCIERVRCSVNTGLVIKGPVSAKKSFPIPLNHHQAHQTVNTRQGWLMDLMLRGVKPAVISHLLLPNITSAYKNHHCGNKSYHFNDKL